MLSEITQSVNTTVVLGGWEERPNRPPGKLVLTRGLRRILDMFAADAILQDYKNEYGDLPPFVKQLLTQL